MSDETKHENTPEHESFEHQDLKAAGIVYFLLTLGVLIMLSMFGLRGLYAYLDHREKASQPAVNPLVTNVPEDTRHIGPGYPQSVFPSPKLEEDERGQLDGIRLQQDDTLYSYGWVDEKAGTVHIPIERAMDLLVQRGLPVRPQGAADEGPAAKADPGKNKTATNKGEKK
ncbi:MAG: hypothetical protein ABSH02_21110 [Candidatus Sulfotelmatobacter sp.]|jgi:hypothetical protein